MLFDEKNFFEALIKVSFETKAAVAYIQQKFLAGNFSKTSRHVSATVALSVAKYGDRL